MRLVLDKLTKDKEWVFFAAEMTEPKGTYRNILRITQYQYMCLCYPDAIWIHTEEDDD